MVVGVGTLDPDADDDTFKRRLVAAADESVLVTRKCYLSLRRTVGMETRPTKLAVLAEPGRALTRSDCERAVGARAVEFKVDPGVARIVDAGMLGDRASAEMLRPLAPLAAPPAPAGPDAAPPIRPMPPPAGRLCGHPLPGGGRCRHRVAARSKKRAAGHTVRP